MIHVQSPSSKKNKVAEESSGWWFQPTWKICSSKWESSPTRDENSKIFELPPPSLETELTLSPSNAMVSGRGPMNRMPAAWHWEMCKTEPISTQTQQNVSKCQQKKTSYHKRVLQGMYMLYYAKPLATIDMNDIDMTWHPQRRIFTPRRQRQSRNFPKGSRSPGGRLQLHWASRENSPEVFSKKTVKGVHSRNLTNWYPNCLPCIEGQLPFPNHPFGYPS